MSNDFDHKVKEKLEELELKSLSPKDESDFIKGMYDLIESHFNLVKV